MAIRNDIEVNWNVSPRIILIKAPSTEITMQDLVDTARYLEALFNNMDDPHLVDASGKENLGGGVLVGITVKLNNARIKFEDRTGPSWVRCDITGGNLVAVDVNDISIDAVESSSYVTVTRTSSASTTISELEITNLQYLIESLRDTHAGFGNLWYWDPINGNDANDGSRPTRAVKTFSKIHDSIVDWGNDVIICLSTATTGDAITTERITISKNRVHVRGPGYGFRFVPDSIGNTITLSGDEISLSGVEVTTSGIGSNTGIYSSGKYPKINNCFIDGCTKNGIYITEANDGLVLSCSSTNNVEDGIHVCANTVALRIDKCIFSGNGIYGVDLSNNSTETHVSNASISGNNQYGLRVDVNSTNNVIEDTVIFQGNAYGHLYDLGTGTFDGTKTSREVTNLSKIVEAVGRPHHRGFGDIWYWSPAIGRDVNDGRTPNTAFKTFAKTHSSVKDWGHDTIFCLSQDSTGVTISVEPMVITKNMCFVRGPGAAFHIHPDTTNSYGAAITVLGYGCELSGLHMDSTNISLVSDGIQIYGNFCRVKNIWASNYNTNVVVKNSNETSIEDCFLGYSDLDGVRVEDNVSDLAINRCHIDESGRHCINLAGAAIHEVRILDKTLLHLAGEYGIYIGTGAEKTQIDFDTVFVENTLGNIYVSPTVQFHYSGSIEKTQLDNLVYLDTTSSYLGTSFPIGTDQYPVNNLSDATEIARNFGLTGIAIQGELTLTNNYKKWTFVGITPSSVINVGGVDIGDASFDNITVKGAVNGIASFKGCIIEGCTGLDGFFNNCGLKGTNVFRTNASSTFVNCYSTIPGFQAPILDVSTGGAKVSIRAYSGGIQIVNFTNALNEMTIELIAGKITLASSCTAGTIVCRGTGSITDNSTGTTVDKTGFTGAALSAIQLKTDTINWSDVTDVRDEAFGRWMLDPVAKTLTLYRSDGVTILKRFMLGETLDSIPAYVSRTPI